MVESRATSPDRVKTRTLPSDFLSAPGLLLVCWCALIAALILIRHVHASVVPEATPFEFAPAYNIGTTDGQTITIGLIVAVVLAVIWFVSRLGEPVMPAVARRAVGWRLLIVASAAGVCVLTFLMLFRPLPASTDCPDSRIVHLNAQMGFVWNCDSSLFQQIAGNPLRLFEEGHPRQSRPMYAVAGFFLVHTVGRAIGWLGFGEWQGEDTRPFISLVLLNVLVLIAAVALFARHLLTMGSSIALTAALSVPLALNGLTAEWTLTPHQQTFAMLVPVVTVLLAQRALVEPPTWRTAGWWGLAVGMAGLAYGSWVVTVPVVVAALLIRLRLQALRAVVAFLAGFAVPTVGWTILCRLVLGSYYSQEAVVYRQFVWVVDSLKLGPADLWQRSTSYLLLTLREILGTSELWIVAAVIALGVVAAAIRRIRLAPSTPEDRAMVSAVALTSAATALFLWGIGYYTPRLSMALFPLLLFAAGWVYSRLEAGSGAWTNRILTAGAAVGVAGWLGIVLT